MSAAARIKEYLENLPEGQPFPSSALRHLSTTDNIRQVLNRFVKAGILKRVARGVFVKPKYVSKVGEILPSALEVAETLAKSTGETIVVHGAEAARQLQLTTQVPMHLVFYTSGNTRTLKIANRTVHLKHVNPSRLVAPRTISGLVISALCYLGQENVKIETIDFIRVRITTEEFKATMELMAYMPGWLSDIFYRYQREKMDKPVY